jgi:hypothetical protein
MSEMVASRQMELRGLGQQINSLKVGERARNAATFIIPVHFRQLLSGHSPIP